MTREQLLTKLKQIDICVTRVTLTNDMGFQIDMLTGDGACQNLGNIGNFPAYKIKLTDDTRILQNLIKEKSSSIYDGEILKNTIIKQLCTYKNPYTGESWIIDDKDISSCINQIKSQIINLNPDLDYWYAFADLTAPPCTIILFNSYKDLCSHCKSEWDNGIWNYDDMNDEELTQYYQDAESSNWYGVPMLEI